MDLAAAAEFYLASARWNLYCVAPGACPSCCFRPEPAKEGMEAPLDLLCSRKYAPARETIVVSSKYIDKWHSRHSCPRKGKAKK